MALINRVARLFAADAHAVIDKLEEPEALLRQALRDIQAVVHEGEQRVAEVARQVDTVRSSLTRSQAQLGELEEELDVCFKAGDEDLARTVIRRRLQLERFIDELGKQLASLTAELERREVELRDQQLALEELEQKVEVLQVSNGPAVPQTANVSPQEVEVAFLREKQRREAS